MVERDDITYSRSYCQKVARLLCKPRLSASTATTVRICQVLMQLEAPCGKQQNPKDELEYNRLFLLFTPIPLHLCILQIFNFITHLLFPFIHIYIYTELFGFLFCFRVDCKDHCNLFSPQLVSSQEINSQQQSWSLCRKTSHFLCRMSL